VGLHLLTYYYFLKSGSEYCNATQGSTAIKCAIRNETKFRYFKIHSFDLQSYILHLNTPFHSENNAESIAELRDTTS